MTKNTEQPVVNTILSIDEKVAFLKQPGSYPFHVTQVQTKETHMSWVFLVNDFAYKLKKPVKYRLLDFSLLESRFRNCREEVRLNRRLAKDIYLGVVPLAVDKRGYIALHGEGTITDWLVHMKRIPEENMLDYAIQHNSINNTLVQQTALLLSEFYKSSPPVVNDTVQYRKKIKREVQSLYRELIEPAYRLPVALIEKYIAGLLHFLNEQAALFDQRVTGEKIIEAHGDLRPEHVCLSPRPAIIDCLEFNRELRILDTAEELSFFAMECDVMGNKTVGEIFFDTYSSATSDRIPKRLIYFYKLKKACLRAFLVIRHITEDAYRHDVKWQIKATAYLQAAEEYYKQIIHPDDTRIEDSQY